MTIKKWRCSLLATFPPGIPEQC